MLSKCLYVKYRVSHNYPLPTTFSFERLRVVNRALLWFMFLLGSWKYFWHSEGLSPRPPNRGWWVSVAAIVCDISFEGDKKTKQIDCNRFSIPQSKMGMEMSVWISTLNNSCCQVFIVLSENNSYIFFKCDENCITRCYVIGFTNSKLRGVKNSTLCFIIQGFLFSKHVNIVYYQCYIYY